MALTLGNGTITYGDSTIQNTAQLLPAGTKTDFFQAAAPTGWIQVTNYSNHMLRVVSGAGGGSGGSHNPVYNNYVPAHTHGFSTGGFSADHVHSDAGHSHTLNNQGGPSGGGIGGINTLAGVTPAPMYTAAGYANLGGSSANHSHSGSTDNGSSQVAWAPQYVDMIICTKN